MRTRSQAAAPPAPKPPEVERNVPLPGTGASLGKALCNACQTWVALDVCTERANGDRECSSCGAPIKGPFALPAPAAAPPTPAAKPEAKSAPSASSPEQTPNPKRYCAECATVISESPIGPFWPCGHEKAGTVDHPDKARVVKPAPGSQMLDVSNRGPKPSVPVRPEMFAFAGPIGTHVEQTATGPRVHVAWGKARMPMDRFNAFECGPFDLSFDATPGETIEALTDRALDALYALANKSFERQRKWYAEKLGLLGYVPEKY